MGRKYRVLSGMHMGPGPTGFYHIYGQDSIVESDFDLLLLNGRAPMKPKFELVTDAGQPRDWQHAHLPQPGQLGEHLAPASYQGQSQAMNTIQQAREAAPAPAAAPAQAKKPGLPANLDNLSVKDLQALCDEYELEYKGSGNKHELLKLLRSMK